MKNKRLKKHLYIFLIIILLGINFYHSNFTEDKTTTIKTVEQTSKSSTMHYTARKIEPKSCENVIDNSKNIDTIFKPYILNLQKKIHDNWAPENHKRNLKTTINFVIDKNGNLIGFNIKEPSKVNDFDKKALETIIKASPFDKLPEQYKQNTIQIDLTFEYRTHHQIK